MRILLDEVCTVADAQAARWALLLNSARPGLGRD